MQSDVKIARNHQMTGGDKRMIVEERRGSVDMLQGGVKLMSAHLRSDEWPHALRNVERAQRQAGGEISPN